MVLTIVVMVSNCVYGILETDFFNSTLTCCGNGMLECFENHAKHSLLQYHLPTLDSITKNNSPLILFISYYTQNVRDHALYTYALNSLYANRFGSTLHLLSPNSGHDFEKHDQRWNKVMIFEKYLEFFLASLRSGEKRQETIPRYLVWLDADLAIVDHSLDLYRDVISKYPDRDLLISKEINPINGIANSGCFIAKVSDWSLRFFQLWWRVRDRSEGMDQHVFDILFRKDDHNLGTQSHIQLLEVDAINSKFPGLINYEDNQPIFHLAGESNFIRSFIFRNAWLSICHQDHYDNHQRLNISRNILDNINYTALHDSEWSSILQDASLLKSRLKDERMERWTVEDLVNDLRYRVREAQQSINKFICRRNYYDGGFHAGIAQNIRSDNVFTGDCVDIQNVFHAKMVDILRILYEISVGIQISIRDEEMDIYSEVEYIPFNKRLNISSLQQVLDTGLELALVEHDSKLYLKLLGELRVTAHSLKKLVPVPLLKFVMYYEFKIQEFVALYHERIAMMSFLSMIQDGLYAHDWLSLPIENGIIEYAAAYSIWRDMHELYHFQGGGNGILTTYQESIGLLKKILFMANLKYIALFRLNSTHQNIKNMCDWVYPQYRNISILHIVHQLEYYLLLEMNLRSIDSFVRSSNNISIYSFVENNFVGVPQDVIGLVYDSYLLMLPIFHCQNGKVNSENHLDIYRRLLCMIVMFEESDTLTNYQREFWRSVCSSLKGSSNISHTHLLSTQLLSTYTRYLSNEDNTPESRVRFVFDSFSILFMERLEEDTRLVNPKTKRMRKKSKIVQSHIYNV